MISGPIETRVLKQHKRNFVCSKGIQETQEHIEIDHNLSYREIVHYGSCG